MPEPSKPIAFRVGADIEQQIQVLAQAAGQSKGEWVRTKVMEILHAMKPVDVIQSAEPRAIAEPEAPPSKAVEPRLAAMESALRQLIHGETKAVDEAIARHEPPVPHQDDGRAAGTNTEESSRGRRIYSFAKELKMGSEELVRICSQAGVNGKVSALANLTDDEEAKILAYLRRTRPQLFTVIPPSCERSS